MPNLLNIAFTVCIFMRLVSQTFVIRKFTIYETLVKVIDDAILGQASSVYMHQVACHFLQIHYRLLRAN